MVVEPISKILISGSTSGVSSSANWKLTSSPVVTRDVVAKPVFTYTLVDVAVSAVTLTAAADATFGESKSV